jgi:Zn finger protein HypA/HybF involved in hydrogenase expression
MKTQCDQCGEEIEPNPMSGLCGACRASKLRESETANGAEFDHRGILMPARTRVGGIIIPQ